MHVECSMSSGCSISGAILDRYPMSGTIHAIYHDRYISILKAPQMQDIVGTHASHCGPSFLYIFHRSYHCTILSFTRVLCNGISGSRRLLSYSPVLLYWTLLSCSPVYTVPALVVLHQEPQILHRDLSWPNVVKSLNDPQKWFINDWGDTAVPPTIASSHFNRKTHAPKFLRTGMV